VHPLNTQYPGNYNPAHATEQEDTHGPSSVLAVDPHQDLSVELECDNCDNGVQEHL
jgi:hypothetical protein